MVDLLRFVAPMTRLWMVNTQGFSTKLTSLKVFALILALMASLLAGVAESTTTQQVGPPVIFVHGICERSMDFVPMAQSVARQLHKSMSQQYPNTTIYSAVASQATSGSVNFYDANGNTLLTPPANSRFFAISFHDPIFPSNSPSTIYPPWVMSTTVGEKGDELGAVIAAVKQLTGIPKVALVGHSLGGLASRSYLENIGANWSHLVGGDSDVISLTTIDTPHIGSPLPLIAEAASAILPACFTSPTEDLNELKPTSDTLNKLNYLTTGAKDISSTVMIDSVINVKNTSLQDGQDWWYDAVSEGCNSGPNDGVVCELSQMMIDLHAATNYKYANYPRVVSPPPIFQRVDDCPSTNLLHQFGCLEDGTTASDVNFQVSSDVTANLLSNVIDVEPNGTDSQAVPVELGQTQTFTATLNGQPVEVNWMLREDPASLLIDGNGNFLSSTAGTVHVVATDAATGKLYGVSTVAVAQAGQNPLLSISIQNAGGSSGILTSSPILLNCLVSCSANFPAGTVVTLIASPNPGSVVSNWSGCQQSSGNSCTVTIISDRAVSLSYSTPQLTELPAPSLGGVHVFGSGSTLAASFSWSQVAHNSGYRLLVATQQGMLPTNLNSGSCPSCLVDQILGTNVASFQTMQGFLKDGMAYSWEVHARAAQPYSPGTWSAIGSFTTSQSPGEVDVTSLGIGSGTVTSSPAGINCPGTCSAVFAPNTVVTLSQSAGQGSTFQGWGGACGGTASCAVTATGVQPVYANFGRPSAYQLSIGVSGKGKVTSADGKIQCTNVGGICSAVYANGTQVTLNATPGSSYQFSGWATACSGTGSCQVAMNQNMFTLAQFVLAPVANGVMKVNASSFAPVFTQGDGPAVIGLYVTNSTGEPMVGTATASVQSGGNWLAVDGLRSYLWSAPETMTISFNPTGLTPGAYIGAITLISAQASNSPLTVPITMTVRAPLTITTPASLPDAISGKPYSVQLTTSTGTKLRWSLVQGPLPSGLTANSATGVISGIPGSIGNTNPMKMSFEVQDAEGQLAGKWFTINWRGGVVITLWNNSLGKMTVGTPVYGSVGNNYVVNGGTAPYSWSLQGAPPGVSISTSGTFSGAPTVAGEYSMLLMATDSTGLTRSVKIPVTVTMLPITIYLGSQLSTPPVLSPVTVGTNVGEGIGAYGGTQAGYKWVVTGTLPPGITTEPPPGCTASTCGLYFIGTSTKAGRYSFQVKVTDSGNNSALSSIVWVVNPNTNGPKITTTKLALGTIGTSYSQQLTATGGKAPLTWKLVTGKLDSKLAVTSGGLIQGVASLTNDCLTGPGIFVGGRLHEPYLFVVMVTDANGESDESELCLPEYYPEQVIQSLSPSTVVGKGMAQTITVKGTGFVPSSQIAMQGQPLPTVYISPTELQTALSPGLGGLFVMPGGAGLSVATWPVRVQGDYMMSSKYLNWTLANPKPVLTSVKGSYGSTDSPCTPNFGCHLTITGAGLVPGSTVQVAGDSETIGLDSAPQANQPWNQATYVGWNPTATGTYTVIVTNRNQPNGAPPATAQGTITIFQDGEIVPIPSALFATATRGGTPATTSLTVQEAGAIGNPGTFTASTQSGGGWLTVGGETNGAWAMGVPLVVALNPGNLSPGIYNGTIILSVPSTPDGPVSVPVTMKVLAPLTITTASTLPTATNGNAYSLTLHATGGTGLKWQLASSQGVLPSGLTLDAATGVISGTPAISSSPTNAEFTIGVTDANGRLVWKAFTMSWK